MYLVNKIISILLIISFLFPHWPLNEECPKCPQCVECVEKECGTCVEKECPLCEECETCEGQCLSDEVIQTLYVSIQELEYKDSTNIKIIENFSYKFAPDKRVHDRTVIFAVGNQATFCNEWV